MEVAENLEVNHHASKPPANEAGVTRIKISDFSKVRVINSRYPQNKFTLIIDMPVWAANCVAFIDNMRAKFLEPKFNESLS